MNPPYPLKCLSGLFIILFIFLSCEDKPSPAELTLDWRNLDLTEDFQTGSRNAEGIDTEKLNDGITAAKELANFYSIAVIYKGRLVAEEYKYGDLNTKYPVWSVTKSFLSTLVGIAIDKGIMADEFQSLESFYPNLTDSIKGKITVAQLLTMSSGIPDDTSYMSAAYPLNYILVNDLLYPSGTYWNYTSAGTHVLSYILTASTKESANSFGKKYLFPQLGITDYTWQDDAYGISNGGFGLNMRLRDMAKLGQLFLQNGKSAGEEIISSGWVNKSSEMIVPFNANKSNGYGYLWWMRMVNGEKMYYAAGYGGQYIMVVPTRALVVAITSSSQYSGAYGENLNRIFYQEIIGSFSTVVK
ncbi:MAG: serine hydrolase [Candidatus Marinimicrobia bacterium]|jgi:hypothetical protein|nr:serine hydrolase [Candidatus Neomarinimicrobiota bacterium]MBT3676516.1 serine hydrolase [Candidatus Neomarinimicrobiota bacterium]MBT3763040.1 serine hydrolase [Candidatus Neomarinimicrobiota bacterium]MBT4068727.1 serine hydrolase [Candidatus Neomarinimicrobiota bacterium]MBT4271476.1 serine hydrolase [Candidatus Neomarinimicrobiota bacterium]